MYIRAHLFNTYSWTPVSSKGHQAIMNIITNLWPRKNFYSQVLDSNFEMYRKKEKKVKLLSCAWLFGTPWTVAYRLLHSWDSPGKSTRVGCHFLLQGIFLTQGSNPGLSHCRQTLLPSEPPGKYRVPFNYIPTQWWVVMLVWINQTPGHRLFSSWILLLSVKVVDILMNIFTRHLFWGVQGVRSVQR